MTSDTDVNTQHQSAAPSSAQTFIDIFGDSEDSSMAFVTNRPQVRLASSILL
jgi:hypothetical protein